MFGNESDLIISQRRNMQLLVALFLGSSPEESALLQEAFTQI